MTVYPDPIHVAMVSSEIAPFAKTGGLGDVLGALPKALVPLGLRLSLYTPAYPSVLRGDFPVEDTGIRFSVPVSGRREEASLLKGELAGGTAVFFVRSDKYFDRECCYGTSEGDYPDNAERFVFFSRAVLEAIRRDPPDVLHAHDWQSALSVLFRKTQPHLYPELGRTQTVFTVHNLGYQGLFPSFDWHLLNLDWGLFTPRFLEFYGKINFLKGGLVFADAVTTVSPTYTEEIKTPEQGFGLDGIFRERAASLVGILNGVDYEIWSPERDRFIIQPYSPADLAGKSACKADLQRTFGLPENAAMPLIGMVTRLTTQKGLDLLEKAAAGLFCLPAQFVVLGNGNKNYEDWLTQLHSANPRVVGARIGFDESLAHKIMAGADFLLMPSRYEPGGLTQLYALKYATIPIVRATGGLKDTIVEFDPVTEQGNGFVFVPYETPELIAAVDRALALFQRKDKLAAIRRNGMAADFSWERSAQAYLKLYQNLLKD